MKPFNPHAPERTFTETFDGVTYHGRWFIDNQVVVLYVGSNGPLTKLILGASPEIAAQQLFRDFAADEIRRGSKKGDHV
jgi:hypothetical protein